jgi:LacI family transcriptional regulator
MPLPQRLSLVTQVAELLRQDLARGRWSDRLPGEHHLSDQFQVSRSTLRAALAVLQKEGLLAGGQGRTRRPTGRARAAGGGSSTVVGVISSVPLHQHSAHSIIILDELRRHLQLAGFAVQLHVVPQIARGVGEKRLRQLVAQTDAACWVLSSCSIELQRWFAGNVPRTLVQGSCHAGVELPFVRCDVAAACRHAVAALRRRGHERLALLLPDSPFAGAREIETAFRQACADLPAAAARVRLLGAEPAETARSMRRLLEMAPAPSAFIAMMPQHALAAFCVLRDSGLRLPDDAALISLFDDPLLAHLSPRLARYHYSDHAFARKFAGHVLRLARRVAPAPSISILPAFVDGGTLGPAPAR